MTHASHNATSNRNEENTMINQDAKINTINDAIAAANDRSDEHFAAVAASRGNGSATPNWLTCDDLQAILDEVNDGEDWDVVEDEDEIADVLGDARDVMGSDADTVATWTVLVRVHSGEHVTASAPREYVIVWSYGGEDAADIERTKKLTAFVQSAHDYYMEHTAKTFEELRDYQRSDWGDGLTGDEWASADEAAEAGIDAAQQYIESERLTADQVIARAGLRQDATYAHTDSGSVMTGREWAEQIREADPETDSAFDPAGDGAHLVEALYRVANEFPALGDCVATYHATEADATEAAAGLIASLADDIMAWGELTPVAPTGDAAEVAAMREALTRVAARAIDDAINNAGVVRMTREAAELIAASAVSITRVDA